MPANSLVGLVNAARGYNSSLAYTLLALHDWLHSVGHGGTPSLLACKARLEAYIAAQSAGGDPGGGGAGSGGE